MNEPSITVTERDFERLQKLLEAESNRALPGIDMLVNELDRATVVKSEEIGPDVVTMNSTVRFVDEGSNRAYELKLVYPRQAGEAGSVSVLAPVGSALLGLAVGKKIRWQVPGGRDLRLRVVTVINPPESQQQYHL
jgi:regulator of nucleoside diphosphate kinase